MKKIISLTLIFLFFSNTTIQAKEIYKVYYLKNTVNQEMVYYLHKFIGKFSNEEKLFYLIKDYLGENKNILKGIFIENGNLYINFNDDTFDSSKGSNGEILLITTFLNTIFQFEEIKTVTFLKEGNYFITPAGNFIYKYTREDLKTLNNNFIL